MTNQCHMTGLIWACKRNLLETIRILLVNRSDSEKADKLDRTPLYFAVSNESFEAVKVIKFLKSCFWRIALPQTTICTTMSNSQNRKLLKIYSDKRRRL